MDIRKISSFSLQGDFLTKSSEQSDLPAVQYIETTPQKVTRSDQSKNLVNVELNVQDLVNLKDLEENQLVYIKRQLSKKQKEYIH